MRVCCLCVSVRVCALARGSAASPMLPYNKRGIFAYAHAYGVPYFKDSTPAWSTRGKLRNQLQPLLQHVYGEGVGTHHHTSPHIGL
jgi:tRNA(Ile)-lysidine synthase TilS/MesJ